MQLVEAVWTRSLMPINPDDKQLIGPRLWHIRAVRDLSIILIIIGLVYLTKVLSTVLLTVLTALLLAYICHPAVVYAEKRWRWSRSLTSALILSSTLLGTLVFLILLWPVVVDQSRGLMRNIPEYLQTIEDRFGLDLSSDIAIINLLGDPNELIQQIGARFSDVFSFMRSIITTTTTAAVVLILIPIFFFYFTWRFDAMLKALDQYLPDSKRDHIHRALQRMDQATAGFFRGRILISAVVLALLAIGWWLVGVPYWFVLALVGGILNVAPYASIIVVPLAITLSYVEGSSNGGEISLLMSILWPSLVYIIAQAIDNWVLTPWIESDKTKLSIPTLLISVFIGGQVAGFLGLLLAIPAAACIKIFLEEAVLPRLKSWARQA